MKAKISRKTVGGDFEQRFVVGIRVLLGNSLSGSQTSICQEILKTQLKTPMTWSKN